MQKCASAQGGDAGEKCRGRCNPVPIAARRAALRSDCTAVEAAVEVERVWLLRCGMRKYRAAAGESERALAVGARGCGSGCSGCEPLVSPL